MLAVFGGLDPLIVVERDRALSDIEQEIAIGAFVVFPAFVGKSLDRLLHREGLADDLKGPRKNTVGRSPPGRALANALMRCRSSLLQMRPIARSCRGLWSGWPVPLTTVLSRAQANSTASRLSVPNSAAMLGSDALRSGNRASDGTYTPISRELTRGGCCILVGRIRVDAFARTPCAGAPARAAPPSMCTSYREQSAV